MATRTIVLTDEQEYQQQRAALGLIPDDDRHQQTLRSIMTPPKAKISYQEQKIVAEVRREWETQQENERLMLLEYKCSKLKSYW
jgi:hypothetical protein